MDFKTAALELKFLRTFLKYTADRCFKYANIKYLLIFAKAMERRPCTIIDIIDTIEAANDVQRLKSEIREVYRIVSRSSNSHNHMSNEFVMEFMESLLKNLKDLVNFKDDLVEPLKMYVNALIVKLRFLTAFLFFTGKRCTDHEKLNDLFFIAKVSADKTAYLSYLCLFTKIYEDEDMLSKLISEFFDMVRKIDLLTPEIRHLYIAVLKASSSSESSMDHVRNKMCVNFVESLLEMLMELLSNGVLVCAIDQILILEKDLRFLRGFLIDWPNKYTDSYKLTNLLDQSLVISEKAGSLVLSLYDETTQVEELYSSLLNLQKETELIRIGIPELRNPRFQSQGLKIFEKKKEKIQYDLD